MSGVYHNDVIDGSIIILDGGVLLIDEVLVLVLEDKLIGLVFLKVQIDDAELRTNYF